MFPIGTYRSHACKEMLERVSRDQTVESLKINIDIDQILAKRDMSITETVLHCIEDGADFLLYANQSRYAVIEPSAKRISCYVDGQMQTMEVAQTSAQFANCVRIAYVVYDQVYVPKKSKLLAKGEKLIHA